MKNPALASCFAPFQYDELTSKGNFEREDIVTALTAHDGNLDLAFQELNKLQLRPFLMRIWGQGDSGEVASGAAATEGGGASNSATGAAGKESTTAAEKEDS